MPPEQEFKAISKFPAIADANTISDLMLPPDILL